MKKKLLIVGIVFVLLLLLISNFGFTIGNVTIGHQEDSLAVEQISSLENSAFNTTHLKSDKVICLNLWATWCVPCVEEMPMLNKIKSKYKTENIEFLSFSIDTDSTRLSNFLSKKKFDFKDITFENLEHKNAILNFLESKPLNQAISSQSIPVTYFIKNNKVIAKIDGQAEENELISEINKVLNK